MTLTVFLKRKVFKLYLTDIMQTRVIYIVDIYTDRFICGSISCVVVSYLETRNWMYLIKKSVYFQHYHDRSPFAALLVTIGNQYC